MTLSNLQSALARKISTDLRVMLPAVVESYDAKTQSASVTPTVARRYIDGEEQALPTQHRVPVQFPQTAEAGMTLPLKKGDHVMLVCADRSLDEWKQRGGPVAPEDRRQHSLNDAVALPGLVPFNEAGADAQHVVIYHGASKIVLKENGDIDLNGVTIRNGDVIIDGVSMKNHVHDAATGTPPLTAPPNGGPVTGKTGKPEASL